MSQITTHILDTSIGKPASGVDVTLFQMIGVEWLKRAVGKTNDDGRVVGLLDNNVTLAAGNYKLNFSTESYFQAQQIQAFYPYIDIIFSISGNGDHYHIPLLLNPFGYSTYRGS